MMKLLEQENIMEATFIQVIIVKDILLMEHLFLQIIMVVNHIQ